MLGQNRWVSPEGLLVSIIGGWVPGGAGKGKRFSQPPDTELLPGTHAHPPRPSPAPPISGLVQPGGNHHLDCPGGGRTLLQMWKMAASNTQLLLGARSSGSPPLPAARWEDLNRPEFGSTPYC